MIPIISPMNFFELDLEFHTLYLAASGNQKAVNVFRDMQPFTYASGTYVSQPHYRDCECVEEHQAILDAALGIRFRRTEGSRYRASE